MFLEEVLLGLDPRQAQGKDVEMLQLILDRSIARIEEKELFPEVEAAMREIIGKVCFTIARYDESEMHLRRALELFVKLAGEHDLETHRVQHYLGGVLLRMRRWSEAEELFRSVHRRPFLRPWADPRADGECAGRPPVRC